MACLNICSHSAIKVVEDSLGFRYPMMDEQSCTKCGLCFKVCPQLTTSAFNNATICYAAAMANEDELLTCSSGGVGTVLAQTVVKNGGIVVGCSGEDMHHVRHIVADSVAALESLKGSKYVQSEIGKELYRRIRNELVAGRLVLFIGTGCQVAGLKHFLLKPYENLMTVDLVCHGVPSQRMLNENIASYRDIDPNSVRFRRKVPKAYGASAIRFGWSATTHSGASISIPWHREPYLAAFMSAIDFRSCCYSCKYARPQRVGDITIADFWSLGKDSALSKSSGVSLVLVNSEKGATLLKQSASQLRLERREINEAIEGNDQLHEPSHSNSRRKRFEQLFVKKGFVAAAKTTAIWPMTIKRIRVSLIARLKSACRKIICRK